MQIQALARPRSGPDFPGHALLASAWSCFRRVDCHFSVATPEGWLCRKRAYTLGSYETRLTVGVRHRNHNYSRRRTTVAPRPSDASCIGSHRAFSLFCRLHCRGGSPSDRGRTRQTNAAELCRAPASLSSGSQGSISRGQRGRHGTHARGIHVRIRLSISA